MKTLITGAAGMLGTALRRGLAMDKTYKVYASDIDVSDNDMLYLDVRDFKQIESFMLRFKPDIVLHLAAETNVDKCQTETRHAYTANTLATENMALSCLRYNTPLVYISTAAVFDGKKKMSYTEFDEPNPLNIYAKTKWEGEKIVHSLLSRYYIIRAGWMIGGVDKDKKFVAKIFNLIKTKKEISVVTDKIGSPTFTEDLARGIIELVSLERYGLYHMANQGSCSRYEIAKRMVEIMNRADVVIKPITSDKFPLPAPRGDSEAIENFKLNLLGICKMRSWQEALKEYVEVLMQQEK